MLPFPLFFHPAFTVDLGPHVFPAQKYVLVRDRLLKDGIAGAGDFAPFESALESDLLRVHTKDYVLRILTGTLSAEEIRVLEIPWSRGLVDAALLACGAAIEASRRALEGSAAVILGGGFHHACPDHGEGFCLVHDVAVGLRALRASGDLRRAAILDLDVHQGNGTAAIFGGDRDTFTVSLHQEDNYPFVKPPSTLDVGLPDDTTDEAYLEALAEPLAALIAFEPDLVYYLAGADPYRDDLLGGLALSLAGLETRDGTVFRALKAAGVPVVVTLAGGYAGRTEDTITIHANTVRAAAAAFQA